MESDGDGGGEEWIEDCHMTRKLSVVDLVRCMSSLCIFLSGRFV